jgi:hypothetical protein
VGLIAKNIHGDPFITFEGSFGIGSVQCFFEESQEPRLAMLSPGESVYVRGIVKGEDIFTKVLLNDCTILE